MNFVQAKGVKKRFRREIKNNLSGFYGGDGN